MATTFYTFVELMSGVPLDPQYKHTLTFNNATEQRNYFTSKVTHSSNNFSFMSYQRYQNGVIKVEASMNLLGNVNYLRFTNTNFSGEGQLHEAKNFYAFIRDISYISDRVVAITYQVDVLQTWMFDYTVNPCYVEREHANSDNVGDNRVTEGLDTGAYVTAGIEKIAGWDSVYSTEDADVIQNTTFVIAATQAPDGSQYSYQYNGVASSMYVAFAYSTVQFENILESFRNGYTGNLDPIISIGMMPSFFKPNATSPINPVTTTLQMDQSIGFGGFMAYDPATTGVKTYIPKNNKLYCYPYNYMILEGPDGNSQILKFEDFRNNNVHRFYTSIAVLPDMETMCEPMDYETPYSGSTIGANIKYAICSKAYPYCAVASDSYSAWWAQNRYSMPFTAAGIDAADAVKSSPKPDSSLPWYSRLWQNIMTGIKGASEMLTAPSTIFQGIGGGIKLVGDVANAAQQGSIGGVMSAVGDIATTTGEHLASTANHKAVPDTMATKANNSGIIHYREWDCYKILYTKIRPEYAEIIDNYFSCYGYACHKVKTPNVTGRRSWNYVKTVGCTINGNVPLEAEEQITEIFDRGVTFWHNPATIHNYNADNSIV